MTAKPPLQAAIIPVTPLQQNCCLIWCTETMRGAFTDPGGDLALLKGAAAKQGVTIEKLLITHGHLDHCGQAGILAKELGVNRYERITGFDFSTGDSYWQQTAPFWADVRVEWAAAFAAQPAMTIVEEVEGLPLFAALFEQAETLTANGGYESASARTVIKAILDRYID